MKNNELDETLNKVIEHISAEAEFYASETPREREIREWKEMIFRNIQNSPRCMPFNFSLH